MGDWLVIEKVVHIVAEHLNEERLSLFCLIESDFLMRSSLMSVYL